MDTADDPKAPRHGESEYQQLVESSPEAIAVHSGGVMVYANRAAARLIGAASSDELIGKRVLDFVHPDDRPLVIERIRRTQGEGLIAEAVQERFVRLDGAIMFVETTALPTTFEGQPATQVVVRDVTARVRAETTLRFLARASAELSESLDYRTTLRTIAALAVPQLGDWCVVDLMDPDGSFERVAIASANPEHADLARSAQRRYGPPRSGSPPAGSTMQVVNDVDPEQLRSQARDPEHARLLEVMLIRSYVSIPLQARGRRIGTLSMTSSRPGMYDPDTVALAEELARRSALAIDNARLYASERAARAQLNAILGGIADGALVQDAQGRFIFANQAAAELAGFKSVDEYTGATATEISARLEVVDADGRPFDYDQLPARRALRGEAAPEMIVQFRRRDSGETRWSSTRSTVVRGADGELLAISIFHDLTERIRAERRLQFLAEAGARLGASLDEGETLSSITTLAVERLADWAVVYVLDEEADTVRQAALAHRDPSRVAAAEELQRRYPPRRQPDTPFWKAMYAGAPQLVYDIPDSVLVQSAESPEHLELLRTLEVKSVLYAPIQARGRTLGVLVMMTTAASYRQLSRDDLAVAEEIGRRAGLALDNARLFAQSQAAIRARDEFLSIASHELRNPVASISGVAQLLEREYARGQLDPERVQRYIGSLGRTATRLADLTEDLLDVSRLRQGRLPLRPEQTDISNLVREVIARSQAAGDEVTFNTTMESDPCPVMADADRVSQVLSNLVGNAVKYNLAGAPIDIRLENNHEGVLLSVCDRGIGLPAGTNEMIFEPFGRAPNAAARNIPGLGLGLYISRQIAERHGGRLWAESPGEGKGTTFRLWLPRSGPAPDVDS